MTDTPTQMETATCKHCGTVVAVEPTCRPFTHVVCPSCQNATPVRTKMGVYEIESLIGIGGMSEVYRAHDTVLGRHVALKVLNEQYSSHPIRRDRFMQEAKAMAKIRHDNAVTVYGAGEEYGCFYIAMEMVNGGDVETYMHEEKLVAEDTTLKIAIQVVDVLDLTWEKGLLHRDIKPANILLTPTRDAKVVDFGLSSLCDSAHQEQEIWVTPYYAPPETLRREEEDFRADMYALGCSLYHMLAGKPPIEKQGLSVSQLCEEKKTLLSLRKVAPFISKRTARIVDRMMAYDKGERYQSYGELREDLQGARAALKGESQPKRSTWALLRRRKHWQKKKIMVIGTVVVVLLTLSVTGGGFFSKDQPTKNTTIKTPSVLPVKDKSPEELMLIWQESQSAIEHGDLDKARRNLADLRKSKEFVPSLKVAAIMQDGLCAWIAGNTPEAHLAFEEARDLATSLLKEQKNPDLLKAQRVLNSFLSSDDITRLVPEWENVQEVSASDASIVTSYVLGMALKYWHEGEFCTSAKYWDNLKNIANLSGFKGAVNKWNRLTQPYWSDINTVRQLAALEVRVLPEVRLKLKRIEASGEKKSTPGSAFTNELGKMSRETQVLLTQKEAARDKRESERKAREAAQQAPPVVQHTDDPPPVVDVMDFCAKGVLQMKNQWNFSQVQHAWELEVQKVTNQDDVKKMESWIALAKGAEDFLAYLGGSSEGIDHKKVYILPSGEKCLIEKVDRDKLHIRGQTSGYTSITWRDFGKDNVIALHRALVQNMSTSPAVYEKHRQAIYFLYATGYVDDANKAAENLGKQDDSFSSSWHALMESIQ